MSVVAIGDRYTITALRLAGVEGREVNSVDEAEAVIDQLVKDGKCKVLLVPEDLAIKLKRKRNELIRERRYYPVFAIIPGLGGAIGERTNEIYQLISQAIGVKLKLGEE